MKVNIEVMTVKNGVRSVRTRTMKLYVGICRDVWKAYEKAGYEVISVRIL